MARNITSQWERVIDGYTDSIVPNEPELTVRIISESAQIKYRVGCTTQNDITIQDQDKLQIAQVSEIPELSIIILPPFLEYQLSEYTDSTSGNKEIIELQWQFDQTGIYICNNTGAALTIKAGTYLCGNFNTMFEYWLLTDDQWDIIRCVPASDDSGDGDS
jgi:hypothetical protein